MHSIRNAFPWAISFAISALLMCGLKTVTPNAMGQDALPTIVDIPQGSEVYPSTGQAGFIFVDSDRRRLTRKELGALRRDELRIARNEIYARKGSTFQDPALTAYFSRFSWYQPKSSEVSLNAIEEGNVDLIRSLEEFIFPDSDTRRLTREELRALSRDKLRIARNEIYARKGRTFQDPALTAYFSRFSWYQPKRFEVSLNAVEEANAQLIQSFEH